MFLITLIENNENAQHAHLTANNDRVGVARFFENIYINQKFRRNHSFSFNFTVLKKNFQKYLVKKRALKRFSKISEWSVRHFSKYFLAHVEIYNQAIFRALSVRCKNFKN